MDCSAAKHLGTIEFKDKNNPSIVKQRFNKSLDAVKQ